MTDVFSWGDSSPEDPFDDDSWMSEPESICNNWRGWKKATPPSNNVGRSAGYNNNNNNNNDGNGIGSSSLSNLPNPNSTSASRLFLNNNNNNNNTNNNNSNSNSNFLGRPEHPFDIIRNNQNNNNNNNASSSSSSHHNQTINLPYASDTGSSTLTTINGQHPAGRGGAGGGGGGGESSDNILDRYEQLIRESNINNNTNNNNNNNSVKNFDDQKCATLTELSARVVARHISFEVVERVCSPIPEQLQLRIAYWSFPKNEEDIRLYSCLANGSADEFQKGETLFRCSAVQDLLQIGFHLSAKVLPSTIKPCTVAVTFDRCRITSCNCTCTSPSSWCSHVVSVCLHRIYRPETVCLRAPVSESLTRLSRDQLQKFAQYLISESPQQILPTAQRLLDDLLLNDDSDINKVRGAPDPTAGAPANELSKWCLDELQLHGNIRKIVIKLCIPSPMVYSDVNYLSSTAPPAAAEWSSLLRPLRGREPEGLWNLLSIVREMLRRHDRNAIPLLRILTEELLSCDQILIWWFSTNVSLNRGQHPSSSHSSNNSSGGSNNRSMHSNIYASQHACCSLCDEIVVLWRLITLNPAHSRSDTQTLFERLRGYHLKTLSIIHRFRPSTASPCPQTYRTAASTSNSSNASTLNNSTKSSDLEIFSGFKPAIVSCLIDWDSYPIPGVTHQRKNHRYIKPASIDCVMNPAICTSTISFNIDRFMWPSTIYMEPIPLYKNHLKKSKKSDIEAKNDDDSSSVNQRKENESVDSGNQEFWERYSVASSEENEDANPNSNNNNNNDDQSYNDNLNEPGPSSRNHERRDSNSLDNNVYIQNDDYRIYFYDSGLNKVKHVNQNNQNDSLEMKNSLPYEPVLLNATNVKPIEDPFEILFARAEALYAHGYVDEACHLSVELAEELLNNPPDLQLDLNNSTCNPNQNDQPGPSTSQLQSSSNNSNNNQRSSHTKRLNRNRFNPALHQISLLTSATLSKAAFLCQVLSENPDSHLLAFNVGLFGLELVRPPASTKALEVKLAHQEQELVNLLKRIPLGPPALQVLRKKAEQLRDGHLTTRGEALLPLSLASYIFEALLFSNQLPQQYRLPSDERLVFDAAVAAIGLKAKVSEAEHPLLCEGTRRQRGDLALNLLVHYKDKKQRLDLIMDKLLDQEIHPIFNSNKKSTLYGGGSINVAMAENNFPSSKTVNELVSKYAGLKCTTSNGNSTTSESKNIDGIEIESSISSGNCQESEKQQQQPPQSSSSPTTTTTTTTSSTSSNEQIDTNVWNLVEVFANNLSSSTSNNNNSNNDCGCVNNNNNEKPNSMDSSAPDTTSSDNSPTVSRRTIFHKSGKSNSGSESSSSSSGGESSSSSSSSSDSMSATSDKKVYVKSNVVGTSSGNANGNVTNTSNMTSSYANSNDQSSNVLGKNQISKKSYVVGSNSNGNRNISNNSPLSSIITCPPPPPPTGYPMVSSYLSSSSATYQASSSMLNILPGGNNSGGHSNFKPLRYKGKRHYPVIPNQPSEASAHFMFELAKTLLAKAGGNNTTVLFTQPPSSQNCRAPHRLLHMCAFQIGLYALGLHNAVSPNWLSRTYSSHVSWITCQAMEIGHQAIEFLIDTWEGHLTPSEVAALADRASRSQEQLMVKAASELALSCLPHAHALTPSEIQRALIQCKEESTAMLERACLAVEHAAQGGGVYPEVLFDVARKWHDLYVQEKVNEIQEGQQQSDSYVDFDITNGGEPSSSDISFLNNIQQDYYDSSNQQMFGQMDNNSTYSDNNTHINNYFQTFFQASSFAYNPNDMNQYLYFQNSRINSNSYQARPSASCMKHHLVNGNQQQSQHPPKQPAYYQRPTIVFDPQRGYYCTANQNMSAYPPSYNPNTMVLRVHPSQLITPATVPGAQSTGNFYSILGGSTPSATMPHLMASSTTSSVNSPYSYQPPPPPPMSLYRNQQYIPQIYAATSTLYPASQIRVFTMDQIAQQQQSGSQNVPTGQPILSGHHHQYHNLIPNNAQTILGPRQLGYMHAAYRVGMLAMDTLARRVHDDRPQARYSRNPSYGEDVKWLLFIAKKLGAQYVQEFCLCVLTAVASPFVLYDIIMEAGQSIFQSASTNNAYIQTIRSQILNPLIQKCQQMFTSCIYFQIMHITSSDYDEFIATLRTARAAYQLTPGGNMPFNELLQSLKRTKTCKKELWQQITNAMQSG